MQCDDVTYDGDDPIVRRGDSDSGGTSSIARGVRTVAVVTCY